MEEEEHGPLTQIEKQIILELAKDKHGELARPKLLDLLLSEHSIDEREFNIVRADLKSKEIIHRASLL